MNRQMLTEALDMARRLGHYLVATADAVGQPHVAVASRLDEKPGGELDVIGWFCPGTVENVDQNRAVSLVVWEKESDQGYQVIGRVETVREVAIMDGYAPDERQTGPQEEFSLAVRVEKVLRFRQGRHTDKEE